MHTCLTLTDIGGHWYVEREVSGLISKLRSYCDSIHSSDISIQGPSGSCCSRGGHGSEERLEACA